MNVTKRPLPEDLLNLAKREETAEGRLTIFLGMAAGVGKTYAMLEEAHELKKSGKEPVIGIVYTHGRQETASLIEGLKRIPEKKVQYKGKEFSELDLEAVLLEKPSLVLVDELAHTNIPGSMHSKRWQDVIEILENGIDVYTTLNVQHIESLKDIVEGIVGTSVRETVPDLIIERASSIRFIDITPDQLQVRLKEGKVYLGDQSKIAVEHFFQKDRLTALREIALRYAAEKVHLDLSRLPPITETRIDWKPREKFLVAVSHSPHSQKLIRTARRLSSNSNATWIALNVDTGRLLSESDMNQLDKNLTLASQLGGEVITVNSPNIIEGIKIISREKGVTQIIIGRPPKISFLSMLTQSTLIDQLAAECNDIDIHVIRQERYNAQFRKRFFSFKPITHIKEYLYTLLSVGAISGLNVLLLPFLGYKAVGFIFLLGIMVLSLYLEKGPILFASLLFAAIWNFFFIPPTGSFRVTHTEDLVLLVLYFLSAMIIGILLERARKHQELLAKAQKTSHVLFDFVKAMAESKDAVSVFELIKKRLESLFDGSFDIVIKKTDKSAPMVTASPLLTDEQEKSAFIWAFLNGKEAGWSTDTLRTCKNLYLPFISHDESHGLLIYRPNSNLPLTHDEKKFLATLCRQIAAFIDRLQTEEKIKENEQVRQIERTHGILLKRFSLLFENPIEKAKNALQSIKGKNSFEAEVNEIDNSLEIVTKAFSNVAAMSQLIEGLVPLEKERHRADEIVKECCESIRKSYPDREIDFYSESELPVFDLDYYLIKILIFNVLIFFIESSGSKITVRLKRVNHSVTLTFQGDVQEMSKEKLKNLLEKVSSSETLGIMLARSIAEAHGGTLKAEIVDDHDLLFTFSISLDRLFFE